MHLESQMEEAFGQRLKESQEHSETAMYPEQMNSFISEYPFLIPLLVPPCRLGETLRMTPFRAVRPRRFALGQLGGGPSGVHQY